MGREYIRIKGIETGRYIAMNINGTLYSTVSLLLFTVMLSKLDINAVQSIVQMYEIIKHCSSPDFPDIDYE